MLYIFASLLVIIVALIIIRIVLTVRDWTIRRRWKRLRTRVEMKHRLERLTNPLSF